MAWQNQINEETLQWLLEPGEPGVRYLAMRDLLKLPEDDQDFLTERALAHKEGPIALILDKMDESGFWVNNGPGYNPKYRSTVWSVIMLAQLGAAVSLDDRVERACRHLFENTLTANGQFSGSGTPSGTVDCLQGNLCASMLDLGFMDPRLKKAFEWMARSVTGDGVAPMEDKKAPLRYYSGKCGPGFLCGANNKLPCAWGAVKVMLAFSKLPRKQRTSYIEKAIEKGIEFLFSVDPADAVYPSGWNDKPSGNWWKFGFPVFYVTDLLQNAEALVRLGLGKDQRLSRTIECIRNKQVQDGRWAMEYDYTGKTWVTLRAARVLKNACELAD